MATFAAQGIAPKNPWDVTSTQKKTPSFVSGFQNRSQNIIQKAPAVYNAGAFGMSSNTQATQVMQQKAAAPANNNAGQQLVAKPLASQEQEGINNPTVQQETEETFTDGTSGIDAQGKLATQGLEQQVALHKRQQANAAQNQGGSSYPSYDGSGGIAGMEGMDADQISNANRIIKAGLARGLNGDDIQTALMTALAESGLRNLNYGDRDSVGLFQQRTSQGWGSVDQIMNADYSIGKFYDTLATTGRGANLWNTAQNVQRSVFADGSNYQAQASKASNLWNTYNQNGGISTAPVTQANGAGAWINANNGKYHDYDKAFGAQCVDLYAFYTSGFAGGTPFGVGYAQELWGNHDAKAYAKVGGNQKPQMGDVAIWSNGFNNQGGHVAIVAQDNGNGTIRVLNANATSAGPNGVTVMSNLSKGSLLGYLRPRKLM